MTKASERQAGGRGTGTEGTAFAGPALSEREHLLRITPAFPNMELGVDKEKRRCKTQMRERGARRRAESQCAND